MKQNITDEERKRRSEALKARRMTPEFIDAVQKSVDKRWADPEYREKMTELMRQSPSEETKRKMSKAKLGKKKTESHRQSMSDTQRELHRLFKFIQDEEDVTYREAKKLYSSNKQHWKDLFNG